MPDNQQSIRDSVNASRDARVAAARELIRAEHAQVRRLTLPMVLRWFVEATSVAEVTAFLDVVDLRGTAEMRAALRELAKEVRQ